MSLYVGQNCDLFTKIGIDFDITQWYNIYRIYPPKEVQDATIFQQSNGSAE